MKNIIYTIVVLVIAALVIVVFRNAHRAREERAKALEVTAPSEGLISDKERIRRMNAIAAKKGGRPLDIALGNAGTEPQRERLRQKFAYQSQTKAEALDDAREKLGQVEDRLETVQDEKERDKLERQQQALLQIIANLGGR